MSYWHWKKNAWNYIWISDLICIFEKATTECYKRTYYDEPWEDKKKILINSNLFHWAALALSSQRWLWKLAGAVPNFGNVLSIVPSIHVSWLMTNLDPKSLPVHFVLRSKISKSSSLWLQPFKPIFEAGSLRLMGFKVVKWWALYPI